MEYSTISVLEYFGDILANVGLPKASLEFDSNCVTRIENKYVRRESNWIEKTIESNQIETAFESNQIETTIESNQIEKQVSRIQSETGRIQSETAASTELQMPMMALASDT